MSEFKFGNIDHLKRRKDIEGETGTLLGIEGTDIKLRVLAATDYNPRWRHVRAKVIAEINRLRNAREDEVVVRAYLARVYSEAIVIDWSGVTDADGNDIPFTKEACRQFLTEADDVMTTLENIVYESKHFRGQMITAVVESVKNS